MIQLLLNHGAHVNAKSQYGYTPLYSARLAKCVEAIQLLLVNNADRHMMNNQGWGPTLIHNSQTHRYLQKHVFESYDKSPLAVLPGDKHDNGRRTTSIKKRKRTAGTVVRLNPNLSQHQYELAIKALLLLRQLPVYEVLVFEILGFLSPAAVERIFLPTFE